MKIEKKEVVRIEMTKQEISNLIRVEIDKKFNILIKDINAIFYQDANHEFIGAVIIVDKKLEV